MNAKVDSRLDEQEHRIAELSDHIGKLETQCAVQLEQIGAERQQIEEKDKSYELEVAGRRGYERTVGIILTLGAGLATVIATLF